MSGSSSRQIALPFLACSLLLSTSAGTPGFARPANRQRPGTRTHLAQVVQETSAAQPTSAAPAAAAKPPVKAAAPTVEELPAVDTALLSVLRDLSKAARTSEDVQKIEDAGQKAAISSALDALDAAIAHTPGGPNRILTASDKARFEKGLVAQSWESGMMPMPPRGHASMNTIWAKKLNGLISVAIAGNCDCQGAAGAARIGEYAVILNGRSVLDSGFDIQSQSDVSFWLGKLSGVTADATTCGEGQTHAAGPTPVLKALATADWLQRQAAIAARQPAALQAAPTGAAAPPSTIVDGMQTAARPPQQPPAGIPAGGQYPLLSVPELKPPIAVPEAVPQN